MPPTPMSRCVVFAVCVLLPVHILATCILLMCISSILGAEGEDTLRYYSLQMKFVSAARVSFVVIFMANLIKLHSYFGSKKKFFFLIKVNMDIFGCNGFNIMCNYMYYAFVVHQCNLQLRS